MRSIGYAIASGKEKMEAAGLDRSFFFSFSFLSFLFFFSFPKLFSFFSYFILFFYFFLFLVFLVFLFFFFFFFPFLFPFSKLFVSFFPFCLSLPPLGLSVVVSDFWVRPAIHREPNGVDSKWKGQELVYKVLQDACFLFLCVLWGTGFE